MDAGTTTNKDLDTGGYTAKTCEAIAAMTGGTASQATREAVPPQAGLGNMKMTTSAIGCSMCHRTFNSRYWSFQMRGGWAYTTCHKQETNRLKRKDTHPQYIDDRGVIDVKFGAA